MLLSEVRSLHLCCLLFFRSCFVHLWVWIIGYYFCMLLQYIIGRSLKIPGQSGAFSGFVHRYLPRKGHSMFAWKQQVCQQWLTDVVFIALSWLKHPSFARSGCLSTITRFLRLCVQFFSLPYFVYLEEVPRWKFIHFICRGDAGGRSRSDMRYSLSQERTPSQCHFCTQPQ